MGAGDGVVHALMRAVCAGEGAAFRRGRGSAGSIQEAILRRTLEENEGTEFGRAHGFASIRTRADYAKAVPVRDYDGFLPYIRRIATGREGILTAEPVLLFEPTSGTSSGVKFIPYTAGLKAQYNRAVRTWLADVYARAPGVRRGKHWWSVSPAERARPDFPTAVPVGFDSDAAYLGGPGRVLESAFAVPESIKAAPDAEAFFIELAYRLLCAGDMSLASVWNPSYFLIAFGECVARAPSVIPRLERARAREVAAALESFRSHGDESRLLAEWWPRLVLVSAWEDGAAAGPARALRALVGSAAFQPKGLLATEGVVTIPLWTDRSMTGADAIPAYRSHFLEFLPLGSDGTPAGGDRTETIEGIETGGEYSVVLTTAGGLYRYALGDRVLVTGRREGLPILSFRGRLGGVDLVGEKMTEGFCLAVLSELFPGESAPETAFFGPSSSRGKAPGYALFAGPFPDGPSRGLAGKGEALLLGNYHYRHARNLGQLSALRVFLLAPGAGIAMAAALARDGRNRGGLKPGALDGRATWDTILEGGYVDA